MPTHCLTQRCTACTPQNISSCLHANRVLLALEQNARYCHFTWMDPTRAVGWSKLLALKQVLGLSPYVLWLDADAVFTRFDVAVLKQLNALMAGKDALFSSEFDQPRNASDAVLDTRTGKIRINTGAIFIRSSEWSFQFLDLVYKEAHKWTFWLMEKDQSGFDYWQAAHRAEWADHVKVAHYRHFNSFGPQWKEGDLVYHAAGGIHNHNKFEQVHAKCIESNCKSRLWQGPCPPAHRPAG